MVTRKDSSISLREEAREMLARAQRDIEERTIGYRWYVVEHTPPGEDDIGGYVPPKAVKVSDYFDVQSEAMAWYNDHVADPGKYLKVHRDRLVKTETWMRG